MLIQPLRGLLQLAADLVLGEPIKYAGLDSAVLAHYRLRRWQVALASATGNLPDTVGARLRKNADSTDVPKRQRLWTETSLGKGHRACQRPSTRRPHVIWLNV